MMEPTLSKSVDRATARAWAEDGTIPVSLYVATAIERGWKDETPVFHDILQIGVRFEPYGPRKLMRWVGYVGGKIVTNGCANYQECREACSKWIARNPIVREGSNGEG